MCKCKEKNRNPGESAVVRFASRHARPEGDLLFDKVQGKIAVKDGNRAGQRDGEGGSRGDSSARPSRMPPGGKDPFYHSLEYGHKQLAPSALRSPRRPDVRILAADRAARI